jgi:hypothetical protein
MKLVERARLGKAGGREFVPALLAGLDHDVIGALGVRSTGGEHPVAQPQITEHEVHDLKDRPAVVGWHAAIIAPVRPHSEGRGNRPRDGRRSAPMPLPC